ncbi:Beta-lactamase class C and other penicillin binding proteins [Lactobacillus zymae] [Lactiplantibacillus mudanjiangensis]|uniref:Beta-lactamase class C and other penicillin binding proteins [Lactobacillus zymae] n=2 Tax=Lactiplantibacillus mudanjiangensis TaxID=1296538 RepID=A0A660DY52_9LACO|nr:Beta-lactamase class C and other penicillin binding proteins [Lactobacillus zymae] [Lactiplantibacillus mudanjiangensis]VDG25159.1 Beta-lactamase class C and other penicillin binding proteins [Lactobacillus zymae] [Lactiplantibacillus mudanjiangensis]VDG27962.1 Beta-lactamase class C and other penicillin binding proteins [Lactobacillus zymae] [Lactiplantibacillus mudanjiangensis]
MMRLSKLNRRFLIISIKLIKQVSLLSLSLTLFATAINVVKMPDAQASSVTSQAKVLAKKYHFKGQIMLTKNYAGKAETIYVGDANHKKGLKNNKNTIYPTASLQKAITGAMIEQLVAKHKLSMTTKLSKYYPQVKNSQSITIRQLLDHTSGIYMAETAPSSVLTEQQAYRYTLTHLTSTGNHAYHYTNANYTLLAGIITKITKKSYAHNIQTRIVKPLKLTHTTDKYQASDNLVAAVSYRAGTTYQARAYEKRLFSSLVGAGNLYTNAHDYYKIICGMRNGKVLTRSQYTQLRHNYQVSYAGGMYRYADGTKSNHGADNGYDSYMYATEGNQHAMVYFANQRSTIDANTFAAKLYALVR